MADHRKSAARQPAPGGPTSAGTRTPAEGVRWEDRTSPVGAPPVDTFAAQPASASSGAGAGGLSGVDLKSLHDRLPALSDDELARLSVLAPGTRLEQGGIYFDLDRAEAGPFKAIGGQTTSSESRVIAKRDTDYLLWNRLVGRDAEPTIERPAAED